MMNSFIFPFSAKGAQPIPSFLERQRLTLDEIRKDPFRLTRQRSKLKPRPQEERIDSANTISIDTSKCKTTQRIMAKLAQEMGWKVWKVPRQSGTCDIYWHGLQIDDYSPFNKGGQVNKFPCMAETLKKVNLTRALNNMQMLFPEEYDFYPRTWFLPQQYHLFCADVAIERKSYKQEGKKPPVYIVKPDGGTQGEGIYLIKDPQDYVFLKSEISHAVQEYVSSPLLIDRMKFDLRIYAVIMSLDPIKIYISREGLARLGTIPYKEPTRKNLEEIFMHLTNYSLNKRSETFIHTDRLGDGSKRTLTSVMAYIAKQGHDTCALWAAIEAVVAKTLLAIIPELKIAHSLAIRPDNKVQCFQILGFDIILTDLLKPILLEVNASPSLAMTYEHETSPGVWEESPSFVDHHVKYPLVREVLLLAAPQEKAEQLKPMAFMDSDEETLNSSPSPHNYLFELYPGNLENKYSKLRVLERLAAIYQMSLGLRESLMTANNFRMFARKSCLMHQSTSLTVAALDILYIEIQRKWTDAQPDIHIGLTFQAFLEAFVSIASRSKLRSANCRDAVINLLDYCEVNLEISNKQKLRRAKLPRIAIRYKKKEPVRPEDE